MPHPRKPDRSPWTWACLGLAAELATGTGLGACEPSSRGAPTTDRAPSAVDVGHAPEGPAGAHSSSTPSPSAAGRGAFPVAHWTGRWRSVSCGERSYERWLDIAAEGTFAADDRISPCAPTVTCVWEGIVHRKGSYQVSADDLQLALRETSTSAGPKLAALPAVLSWDPTAGAPVETSGAARCVYMAR